MVECTTHSLADMQGFNLDLREGGFLTLASELRSYLLLSCLGISIAFDVDGFPR